MKDEYDYNEAWKKAEDARREREAKQERAEAADVKRGQELAQEFLDEFREKQKCYFKHRKFNYNKRMIDACADAMTKKLRPFGLAVQVRYYDDYSITIYKEHINKFSLRRLFGSIE